MDRERTDQRAPGRGVSVDRERTANLRLNTWKTSDKRSDVTTSNDGKDLKKRIKLTLKDSPERKDIHLLFVSLLAPSLLAVSRNTRNVNIVI